MKMAALTIILFLTGVLSGWAQTTSAPPRGTTVPPVGNAQIGNCEESVCRLVAIREDSSIIDGHLKNLRVATGGFQQGGGIGAGFQLTTADAIPHVEFRATALATSLWYQRYDLEAYAHDILDSSNHADVWFSYLYRRQDNFFGIGPRFPHTLWTDFASVQRSYQGTFTHDFTDHLHGSVYTQVANTNTFGGKSNNTRSTTVVFSPFPEPNPQLWAPGLSSHVEMLNYGAALEYDARNNDDGLTRGVNLYARVDSADALDNGNPLADFGWVDAVYDGRAYIPLGSNKTSFAFRSRGQFMNPKGGSQIPFYLLSWIGGRDYVRGYQNYRFRGNSSMLFAAELRQTIYTQNPHRGVDVFGFADTGQVWGDARASKAPEPESN